MMIRPARNEDEISLRESAPAPVAQALKIFIADDDIAVAELLVDLVGDLGHELADVQTSHAAAFEAAETVEADIAILDINLRGRPSFAIADKLIARGIPVIFATGYGILELNGKYADAELLKKPFKPADLAQAISRLAPRKTASHTMASHTSVAGVLERSGSGASRANARQDTPRSN